MNNRNPLRTAEPFTLSDARTVFEYDPITGSFSRNGKPCGTKSARGYIDIWFRGRRTRAHRLAWLFLTGEWPVLEIDHKNGNPSDNRASNLRLATSGQNKANTRRRADNSSGVKGVYWNAQNGKWHAQIRHQRKRRHLGYFDDVQAARIAYETAANLTFGEFARVG